MYVNDIKHADYPHTPGTLYGCLSCETLCHCTAEEGSEMCLACATVAEYLAECAAGLR